MAEFLNALPKGLLSIVYGLAWLLAIALGLIGVKQVSRAEWWNTRTCQSRLLPQPDATSIAYRC